MADYNIGALIAGSGGITPPKFDFQNAIGNLPDAYWKGQEQQNLQQQRDLFKSGIPTDANGQPDYSAIAKMLLQSGGAAAVPNFVSLTNQESLRNAVNQPVPPIPGMGGSAPPATASPVPSPPVQAPVASTPRVVGDAEGVRSGLYDPPTSPGARPPVQPGAGLTPNNVVAQNFYQPSPTPTQNVPAQPTEALANAYEKRAEYFYNQSRLAGAAGNKALSDAAKSQAEQASQQGLAIRKSLLESAQPTPDMKNANAAGMTTIDYASNRAGAEENSKQDSQTFSKRYTGIQALGENSYNGIEKAKLMKNLTLDPNFYSGPLHEYSQKYNQFKSVFGSNPSSALPQEAFNKVVNDMLTEQTKAMGQSGVGRVLQTEVNTMKQAIASLGITASSNRSLAEIVSRVYKQQHDIADIARATPRIPGQMNQSLDTAINDYYKKSPMFTPQEMQNPALLGAPDAPPASVKWSPEQKRAWASRVGLKPGDPIRFNGQIMQVP